MFSLAKLSYMAMTDQNDIERYHSYGTPTFDVKLCCRLLKILSEGNMTDYQTKLHNIICVTAARSGHIPCLELSRIYGDVKKDNYDLCGVAASAGKLDCLIWAFRAGHKLNKRVAFRAASFGSVDCLRFIVDNGCPLSETICNIAVKNNHLGVLKYAHINGVKLSNATYLLAFHNETPECFEYLHENGFPLGTPS